MPVRDGLPGGLRFGGPVASRMRLLRLDLTGFRNLHDQALEVPPEGVAILGRNAQGKSNLLEAIHYLEAFRSFRGAREEQMVRFGDDHFRIAGRVARDLDAPGGPGAAQGDRDAEEGSVHDLGNTSVIAVAFQTSTKEKRISVDGETESRVADAIGGLGAVLFTPDDVRLVSDGPVERRRFLDILLSLDDRSHLRALQRFRQALAQRNAALRRGDGTTAVEAWDALLVDSGARVCQDRAEWVRRSDAAFHRYAAEISGKGGAHMCYAPSISSAGDAVSAEQWAGAYRAALYEGRENERRLRTTLVGPHRDELRFLLESEDGPQDAREFGSGGQRRTVALALRLVEADTVRRRGGGEPILLLDDVFAELDEDRSARLLSLLDGVVPGQVILTAPKESDIRFRGESLPRWSIRAGAIAA